MLLMRDAVPQTLWDFPLSAGLADFALAKFCALPKNRNACAEDRALQGGNSSADASPDWRLRNRLSRYPFLRRSTSIFCPTNRVHLPGQTSYAIKDHFRLVDHLAKF
jgi:hypothetical protein